jgi:16S rRNA (cytosine967-C5)-methyltransferase
MSKVTINEEKRSKKFSQARFSAVKILNRYERSDSYVDKLLTYHLTKSELNPVDKSLLTELVNGVIRWRSKLDWVLTGFYHGDYHKCLNLVKNAMRVGLYQMLFLDKIPIPSAIDESVEMVKFLQGERAAGLVNGVLRNIARNINSIRYPKQEDDLNFYYSVIHSHPKWIVKKWLNQFGEEATVKLLETNNQKPYTALRVNSLKASVEEVTAIFQEKEIAFELSNFSSTGINLFSPNINIANTELFKQGKITVQDAAASSVVKLLNPTQDSFVIDLCAAPGGKSFFISELMANSGEILAIDKYDVKLKMLEDSAKRLGLTNIKTFYYDAKEYRTEKKADFVLCDVPCSGTGTFAKKPDIKWKKELEDINQLTKIQTAIINNAAQMVKIGGVLVYSTCSIEPEENMQIIEKFLQQNPNFELDRAENYLNPEICKDGYLQMFPHVHNTDGAFGARLIKKS